MFSIIFNTLLKGNMDENWIKAANSVEPIQTAHMWMLSWHYIRDKAIHDLPLAC